MNNEAQLAKVVVDYLTEDGWEEVKGIRVERQGRSYLLYEEMT